MKNKLVAALFRLWHSSPICTAWAVISFKSTPPAISTALFSTGANSFSIHLRRSRTELLNAPNRSTFPSPSFTEQYARLPVVRFSTMCTGMEGEMIPAIGPTALCSWQGENVILPEAASCLASPSSAALPS